MSSLQVPFQKPTIYTDLRTALTSKLPLHSEDIYTRGRASTRNVTRACADSRNWWELVSGHAQELHVSVSLRRTSIKKGRDSGWTTKDNEWLWIEAAEEPRKDRPKGYKDGHTIKCDILHLPLCHTPFTSSMWDTKTRKGVIEMSKRVLGKQDLQPGYWAKAMPQILWAAAHCQYQGLIDCNPHSYFTALICLRVAALLSVLWRIYVQNSVGGC